ncbi:acyl-CoA synthetase (NDP forming) [Archaeoglobales archaeon]|nr:MAG: acyl-CoA synthetase (NDP forming) [Archaeoglobales archaeon]
MLLMEHESKELLEKHGIKTARCIFVQDENEAIKAAKSIGFPVVMKVASREILHKSDVGGVILNVNNESEAKKAFNKLMSIEDVEGVNVQPMLKKGIEIIIGVTHDEQFGSVLMFGLGGIFVEVLKDVSFRLIPLTKQDAEEMIKETKGYRLLEGCRECKGDVNALIELILKVSDVVENESILEMDLNPVFVYEKGYVVADARIVVGNKKSFKEKIGDISFFFNPKSVAIIGASRDPRSPGHTIVENLLSYKGKIYPINPKAEEILGLKCYPSLGDVDSIDVAIIAVPSKNVVEIVNECAEKNVKGIIVISGGFAEGWEYGSELEREIVEIAKSKGIRIIGPNTMGVLNPENGFTSFFSPITRMNLKTKLGNIGVLSQSGAFANFLLFSLHHIGFSKIISIGNKCDVDEVESLNYLLNDKKTEVIAVYLEGFTNGRAFYELMKKSNKPIVVLKSGRTKAGKKSALTHTASISTSDDVFKAACKQAKVVKVRDYDELVDVVKALSLLPLPKGDRIAVIQPSGAECVMSADAVEENGLRLAEYSDKTLERLVELSPEWHTISNPLDLYPIIEKSGDKAFFEILEIVANDDNVDAIVTGAFISLLLKQDFRWLKKIEKPILFTFKDDLEMFRQAKMKVENLGFPVYSTPERAIRALKHMLIFV